MTVRHLLNVYDFEVVSKTLAGPSNVPAIFPSYTSSCRSMDERGWGRREGLGLHSVLTLIEDAESLIINLYGFLLFLIASNRLLDMVALSHRGSSHLQSFPIMSLSKFSFLQFRSFSSASARMYLHSPWRDDSEAR